MGVKDLDRTNPEIDGSGSGWTALGLNFLGLLYFPSVKIQKCELASKLEGEKMTGFIFGLCRLEGPSEGPWIVCASVRVCVFLSVPWKAPCFCLVSSEQDPRDGARAGCCPLSPSPWEAGNVGPTIQPPHPMAQASGLGRGGQGVLVSDSVVAAGQRFGLFRKRAWVSECLEGTGKDSTLGL